MRSVYLAVFFTPGDSDMPPSIGHFVSCVSLSFIVRKYRGLCWGPYRGPCKRTSTCLLRPDYGIRTKIVLYLIILD